MKYQSGALSIRNLALLLAVAIAVAVAAFIGLRPVKETVVKPPVEIEDYLFWQAKELTDFKLTGAGGKTLGLNDLKGKWSFIFFGYTQCPDVCPLTLGILGQAFKVIEKNPAAFQEIQGVFISVDPMRDTPELLKEYVAYFNNKFTGVTGDTTELEAISRQMSALYSIHPSEPVKPAKAGAPSKARESDKASEPSKAKELGKAKEPVKVSDAYTVTHNSTVFLIDPRGRLYGRFSPPQLPQEIAEVFLKIRTFYNEGVKK